MDKVIISDLRVQGIVGINADERTNPQEILINLTVFTHMEKAGVSDKIIDCVNYSTLSKKVAALAREAHHFTVEALASDIAGLCLAQHGVNGVRVRVEKPGAVRSARSVGVEIERGQVE